MKRIINFSGGKTSAYMTILEYKPGDIVLFCDTGREHLKTYEFIKNFEKNEKIPITWVKYDGGFTELINKKKAIPNIKKRFCTIELKVKTARRYLRSIGLINYENFIGFRFDEQIRIKKRKIYWKNVIDRFPLYEKKITKNDINEFWKNKNYNLEIPSILGNCDLCFLKGKNAIISILVNYPELADKWIKDEENNDHTYFKNISYKQLLNIAQNNLFKNQNLELLNNSYNCICTN